MSVMRSCIVVVAAATVLAGVVAPWSAEAAAFDVVVVSGDAAPDGDGVLNQISGTGTAQLNAAGQVGFQATLSGTANDRGIFRIDGAGGVFTQVARTGQAVPSGGGVFDNFSDPLINDAGQMSVVATSIDGGGSEALLFFDGTTLSKVLQEGDPAQHIGGTVTFSSIAPALINDAGQMTHIIGVTGATDGNDSIATILVDGTGYDILSRGNESVPGGNGTFIDSFPSNEPRSLNNLGQVATNAYGINGDIGPAGRGVYYYDVPGGTSKELLRGGTASPDGDGTIDSIPFDSLLNANSGHIATTLGLTGTASGNDENLVVVTQNGGDTFQSVARSGNASPDGVGDLGTLGSIRFGDDDSILMTATFINTPNPGTGAGLDTGDTRGLLFYDGASTLEVIVRSGQLSPDGVGELALITFPIANDLGQVAFAGIDRDTPGAGTFSDVRTLQVYDPLVGTVLLARQGDAFLGSTFVNLIPSGITDTQLLFEFSLADGREGLALYDLSNIVIPQPSAALAGIAGLTLLIQSRSRRRPSPAPSASGPSYHYSGA